MKQVLLSRGAIMVADVPAPTVDAGTALVRVAYSTISTGTEMSGVRAGSTPLWRRAVRQPDKAMKVLNSLATRGVAETRHMIESRLGTPQVIGYSASGSVLEVGDGVDDIYSGMLVACAGASLANHAEVVRVPRNLIVPIPDGVSTEDASTVTLGAIALQGVRRAQPTLGETFVVVGLGIVGQLTVQLLRANGCRVIGTDLDPRRVAVASELGMDVALTADEERIQQVSRLTDGYGADGVIITAATTSDSVVALAFQMCRKKGRVVLVGDVGLNLNRADLYEKELDFFISTSYGPGRYDRTYEERGLDYPLGYVRWTENRNMSEFLRLVAERHIQLGPLIGATYPVDQAAAAYAALGGGGSSPIAVRLSYPNTGEDPGRVVKNPKALPARSGAIKVGLVGAGSFAKGMHLPNLEAMPSVFKVQAVMSRTGSNAAATASQVGASYATTELDRLLEDPEIDLVLITTRHSTHAEIALRALERGKHVLVEKPLALTTDELNGIRAFFAHAGDSPAPILQTGFNRRFSPHTRRIKELLDGRASPMLLNYRMNAGFLPRDHWTLGPEGGGRNLGEACHIYDLFTFLTDASAVDVRAQTVRPSHPPYGSADNFVATISFEDGSLGTLTYTALGASDHPKEQLDVYVDGKVISLNDYRETRVSGSKASGLTTARHEKGQREELEALGKAVKDGSSWPIPLWQQLQATEIALRVEPYLNGVD